MLEEDNEHDLRDTVPLHRKEVRIPQRIEVGYCRKCDFSSPAFSKQAMFNSVEVATPVLCVQRHPICVDGHEGHFLTHQVKSEGKCIIPIPLKY